MDAGFECSRGSSAGPACSEMLPERVADLEPSGYADLRDRIFIPLVTFVIIATALFMVMKSVPFSAIEKCTTPKGVWG
jgi:hypothetical protein